jgi:hypothetical protein
MDHAGKEPKKEESVTIDIDREKIPNVLQSGSDPVKEQPAGVSPATDIRPAKEAIQGDPDRPLPLKAWDSSRPKAEEAVGQKQSSSNGVSDGCNPSFQDDLEKGKVKTRTFLPLDSSDSASTSHHRQDSDDGPQCRVCSMSSATADVIDLGCKCKQDLGRVHRGCAEKWFRVRGSR